VKFSKVFKRLGLLSSGTEIDRAVVDDSPMLFPCGVSRSGTTLLSAVLDAHSRICMGFEMLFPAFSGVDYILENLQEVRADKVDLRRAGSLIRKRGMKDLGKWISRCHRLGLQYESLVFALNNHLETHGNSLKHLENRLLLIKRVLDVPEVRNGASHVGFKVTDNDFNVYLKLYPNATFVYILRDPRDVYASLKGADFDVTLETSNRRWMLGLESFRMFQEKHPERCQIVRYEDIVDNPGAVIAPVLTMAGLEMEEGMLEFQRSKIRILDSTHPNAENLKKGFFDSSVGRYLRDLPTEDILNICVACGDLMRFHGYLTKDGVSPSGIESGLYTIPDTVLKRKMKALGDKAKFDTTSYEALLQPYIDDSYEVLTLLGFTREKDIGDRKVLAIRHDIDHNHITAMKMAKWEHDHGIISTYCMLHTAWYYGQLESGIMRHTTDLVDCAKYLAGLGHEIILHNNLAVTALKEGIDPVELLRQELDFFNAIGIQIKGTSTHGDSLCRDLNFRNYELFRETCDGRYGGPRSILYNSEEKNSTVTMGNFSMQDFGLEYEAYEIFWDIYHTDSGGRLETRTNRRGMRNFGRKDKKRGSLVGVLTHPVWWKF
jgi:hypothetical protein